MGNPESIFANGSDSKRAMLERLWPELYNSLAGIGPGGRSARAIWCVVGGTEHSAARVPAVARITRMGHPACAEHVAKLADRPGGWPLPAEENQR